MRMHRVFALASLMFVAPVAAQEMSPHDRLAREILKQLIEINTTDSVGSTTTAAEAMAARLKAAGYPDADVQVIGPNPRKGNLVARLRGTGRTKPILLLAHLDVVEASKDDWSPGVDPFTFIERDGFFYGRGTTDDKAQAAIWIANLIRYRQEGLVPDRDLIVALTADEEGGSSNGVAWLLANHRDLIDADYCLNEGGGGEIKGGKHIANDVQAAEKVYHTVSLEVRNAGGHSSLPRKDNAIYRLAAALNRLAAFEFPIALNDVTRTYFQQMARLEQGQVAADLKAVGQRPTDPAAARRLADASAAYNAMMRTTCVPTLLEGGHAENALPQLARAVVNCRVLPGEDLADVDRTLARAVADEGVTMKVEWKGVPSPASPLRADVMLAVEQQTTAMWPGVIVLPVMATGATDGLALRNAGIPTYGVDGLFTDVDDVRAHGRDERIGVKEYFEGREFLYRLVKALATGR
ncbi:MAG: M20/M25/M40 family metallo-hydrolase [Acidobacteria bacterium]|nr:M20/M25/M40 family metallo-hydrolase [Acidobacteriota bacterium]